MPRIVFLADTHLGLDHPIRPRSTRRRRGPELLANYRRVLDHAVRERADLLIHGGDLFCRYRVPAKIVDLVYEPLFAVAEAGIPVLVVPGNHERSRLPDSLLLGHSRIHVFHEPETRTFAVRDTEVSVSAFPYRRDIRCSFPRILAATRWQDGTADLKLLCFHQAVEGAQVGAHDYTFRHGRDVIRLEDIPTAFALALSGHVHRHQILEKRDCRGESVPLVYAGSTERTSFAERYERKGFVDLRLSPSSAGGTVERLDFVPLPTRPMHDIQVRGRLGPRELAGFLRSEIAGIDENSVVRVRCHESVDSRVRETITHRFLRDVLPKSMSIQLGYELRRRARSDVKP